MKTKEAVHELSEFTSDKDLIGIISGLNDPEMDKWDLTIKWNHDSILLNWKSLETDHVVTLDWRNITSFHFSGIADGRKYTFTGIGVTPYVFRPNWKHFESRPL